ncbi:MAG TPA: hypothetical protein VF170_08485 [Planctomycetaceae bacterium]
MAVIKSLLALLAAASIPPGLPTPAESARAVADAADRLGAPFPGDLARTLAMADDARAVWQAVAPHTLLEVEINPEMRVKVAAGRAEPTLVAGRPRAFFVRIDNRCGTTARLAVTPADLAAPDAAPPDWLDVEVVDAAGCSDRLSGAPVEYKLLLCRAAEPGRREVRLGLDAGQGTQDLGFRGVTDILFHVRPNDVETTPEP